MKKVAIPVQNNKICSHFGHCEQFAIITVNGSQMETNYTKAPPHQPGLLPEWLSKKGVTHVIAAGIGQKAIALFNQQNIKVTVGVQGNTPSEIMEDWLNDSLRIGDNACDH